MQKQSPPRHWPGVEAVELPEVTTNPDTLRRFRWFLEHDGYSTPPGRAACALESAKLEQRIEALGDGVRFLWEPDPDPDFSFLDGWCEEDRKRWERDAPHTAEMCTVEVRCGECGQWMFRHSLSGIIDADNNYRRIVEKDLAYAVFDSQHTGPDCC